MHGACRDARPVRPLQYLANCQHVHLSTSLLVNRIERTHEPCVPTYSCVFSFASFCVFSFANACRDARPVRPLQWSANCRLINSSTCLLVNRIGWTHELCVPIFCDVISFIFCSRKDMRKRTKGTLLSPLFIGVARSSRARTRRRLNARCAKCVCVCVCVCEQIIWINQIISVKRCREIKVSLHRLHTFIYMITFCHRVQR